MNALDIWALAIWQADGLEYEEALSILYAVGLLTLKGWGDLATQAATAPLPVSLQLDAA